MHVPQKFTIGISILKLFFITFCTVCSNASDESNHILIQFDLVQLKDWSDLVLQDLKNIIIKSIVSYCQFDVVQCNSSYFRSLNARNVIIESGYPKEIDKRNTLMLIKIVSPFPSNTSETVYFNKSLVEVAIVHYRKQIQSSLLAAANEPYEFSYRISYVNNVLVLETSDQTLNRVLTPLVCAFVVALLFFVWAVETIRWKKLLYSASNLKKKISPQELVVPNVMLCNETEDRAVTVNKNLPAITRLSTDGRTSLTITD